MALLDSDENMQQGAILSHVFNQRLNAHLRHPRAIAMI
jgi:hypothetical protein